MTTCCHDLDVWLFLFQTGERITRIWTGNRSICRILHLFFFEGAVRTKRQRRQTDTQTASAIRNGVLQGGQCAEPVDSVQATLLKPHKMTAFLRWMAATAKPENFFRHTRIYVDNNMAVGNRFKVYTSKTYGSTIAQRATDPIVSCRQCTTTHIKHKQRIRNNLSSSMAKLICCTYINDRVRTDIQRLFSRTFQDFHIPNSRVFQDSKNLLLKTFQERYVKNAHTKSVYSKEVQIPVVVLMYSNEYRTVQQLGLVLLTACSK